jgi:2-polyprenyl-3-methyl-5-hydroxy-6-metoxy-1,4-benzoquinol methylase
MKNELDKLAGAYVETSDFYQDNVLMLDWYAHRMVNTMQERKHRSLISLGIGHTIVSKTIMENMAEALEQYWIIDGSAEIIAEFKKKNTVPHQVSLINEWFENFTPRAQVDAIEMGFVLEHVDNPLSLVKQYAQFLKPGGTMFIAVPNAGSLHRIIGFEAGLLPSIYNLSPQDIGYGHKRYFDLQSITTLIHDAGLQVVKTEGLLLKPIATSQMQALGLSQEVMMALMKVGVAYPELSNAIYMEVTR